MRNGMGNGMGNGGWWGTFLPNPVTLVAAECTSPLTARETLIRPFDCESHAFRWLAGFKVILTEGLDILGPENLPTSAVRSGSQSLLRECIILAALGEGPLLNLFYYYVSMVHSWLHGTT